MDSRPSMISDSIPLHTQSSAFTANRRRPLIEQCTNEWQTSSKYLDSGRTGADAQWVNTVTLMFKRMWAVVKAPKFQRLVAVFIFATFVTILCWQNFLSVYFAESKAAWDSINAEVAGKHGNTFGANKRVSFPGMTQLKTMDQKHLPRTSRTSLAGSKHKRLIFIGDIHGCMDELQALLAKVDYKQEHDHIVALGDIINKGPKSSEVVQFLMDERASCVRGNHDDRILLVAKELASQSITAKVTEQDKQNNGQESQAAAKNREERSVARSLSQKQLAWLGACPVILRIGDMGTLGEVVAVHGGLVPGIKLENQDPMSVMNMRIIDLATHMPSQKHSADGSVPWSDFWNKYQRLMPAQRTLFGLGKNEPNTKHMTVIYGHDAKRGLQIDGYTKGLDSGCAAGGKLTALVVSDLGKEDLVQVTCGEQRDDRPR